MNKKKILLIIFLTFFIFNSKNVHAFSSSDYKWRGLCGNFEVASFKSDGSITTSGCFYSYEEARDHMKNKGADDLAIMTKVGSETKIIDANVALLDLSVNPETLTYFYTKSELTGSAYTYMDTGSLYGGVDGAHIQTAYSSTYGTWVAKVKTGNFTGWIKSSTYEIVPITWIKSSSSYTVENNEIRHNYVAKIQNNYYGSAGRIIGPKPEMLNNGTYYSFDGHYFYKDLRTLIKDYKNDNYNNSVNKDNPYYNYYMYLSNHTKTNYSSYNIDEYIRNNLGYKENVYGNTAASGTSRLYGSGTFFYYAQEKYGVNAILSLSLSRNETGNGRSNLAINKNNGFGLNAVDSNPIQAANWYASFAHSIIGYASKWVTDGYAHPRDWRYFGPQFGDKWIGMNVKYASDTYWSEKMAANYYSLDKAFGLQDYNYYQLGVVNGPTNAYREPSYSSQFVYKYPEREDALVIVGEVTNESGTWYKVISDLNVDNNYNELPIGPYNWNAYVYVNKNDVRKINKAKNGYKSINDITEYNNKDYTYDLYVENAELKPRVGISTKDTSYYYDSSLVTKTNQTLKKDRYVMIYTAAYLNNMPVAYLVTSDYSKDQKEWVSADSIKLTNTTYGKVTISLDNNPAAMVNSKKYYDSSTKISGMYTYTYFPVLEASKEGNDTWYKIPVSLSNDNNVYGYFISKANGVSVELSTPIVENVSPIIKAVDKEIFEGEKFDERKDVTAEDYEDGDLTSKIEITSNNVNTSVKGEYTVTYKVKDSKEAETTKTIKVIVKENEAPIIKVEDKIISEGQVYEATKDVEATDKEDGNLTSKIKVVENNVDINKPGEYKVIYEVSDSKGKKTTKEIKVTVEKDNQPEIKATDKVIFINEKYNLLSDVEATDKEDGNITKNIKVKEDNIDITKTGIYTVVYTVTDSKNNTTTKKINVEVKEKNLIKEDGEFFLNSLDWNSTNKKFTISGYLIILNRNNLSDKKYQLILKNKNSEDEKIINVNSWNKDTPYNLGSENNNSYTNSWFKGEIDLSNIPNGDYDIYMKATSSEYYTEQMVDNLFNQKISKRGEDSSKGYNFKVLLNYKSKKMELSIRDELYTVKEAPTYRNMINDYEEIKFVENKLLIHGVSYNYDGTYSSQSDITRKLIIENQSNYKQYYYDLGSSKESLYKINLADKKDKTYAWYKKEIDISNLPKGTYNLQVYTKTKDATDYGEITDIFASFKTIKKTINDKNYEVYINKNRENRIEILVK